MKTSTVYLTENLAVLLFVGLLTAFVTPLALIGLLFMNTSYSTKDAPPQGKGKV